MHCESCRDPSHPAALLKLKKNKSPKPLWVQLAFSGTNRKERGGAKLARIFRLRVGGLPVQCLLTGPSGAPG